MVSFVMISVKTAMSEVPFLETLPLMTRWNIRGRVMASSDLTIRATRNKTIRCWQGCVHCTICSRMAWSTCPARAGLWARVWQVVYGLDTVTLVL